MQSLSWWINIDIKIPAEVDASQRVDKIRPLKRHFRARTRVADNASTKQGIPLFARDTELGLSLLSDSCARARIDTTQADVRLHRDTNHFALDGSFSHWLQYSMPPELGKRSPPSWTTVRLDSPGSGSPS